LPTVALCRIASVSYCGNCGAERVAGDTYCANCGRAYDERRSDEPEHPITGAVQSAADTVLPDAEASRQDTPFPDWAGIAAGVLTLFMPLISLIVALVMRSSEKGPRRRGFLRNWAIASGAWMCTGWVVVLLLFSSVGGSSGGGCKGGPDPFGVPISFTSDDNKHWIATVPCVDGGTMTRPARKGEVP
jgi:uncharacterized membrane protein